jgi:hypothetical protein
MQQALILIVSLFLAAEAASGPLQVRVPAGISLSADSVREHLRGAAPASTGRYDAVEIVIYYYSPGIETYSYGETDTMSETLKGGLIRALIKCKKNSVLKKALFIEAEGSGTDQILDNFRRAVESALRGV